MTDFAALGLAAPIMEALAQEGYVTPTPIQAQAIPAIMAGRDLQGIAQTGTGKTAAFALPILHRLMQDRKPAPRGGCRVLVLSPTRELASQIAESFRTYGRNLPLTTVAIFGGVPHGNQIRALARGIDVLVATPGRLVDHLDAGKATLAGTQCLVLDEVDQMLDLGFIKAIRRVTGLLPPKRQSLFFSATMPPEIGKLAAELLTDPVSVSVAPVATTVERVQQTVYLVEQAQKRDLLAELMADPAMARTIVFARTKHGADRVAKHLEDCGVLCAAIHGNKSQGQRERALAQFRSGAIRALVATDIAARGIDIDGVTHVVNFDLPNIPESYVHRIGRTARAGAEGIALSFCAGDERAYLRSIEKLTRLALPVIDRRRPGAAVSAAPIEARGDRPPQDHRHQDARHPPRRDHRPPQRHPRSVPTAPGRAGEAGRPAVAAERGGEDIAGVNFMRSGGVANRARPRRP